MSSELLKAKEEVAALASRLKREIQRRQKCEAELDVERAKAVEAQRAVDAIDVEHLINGNVDAWTSEDDMTVGSFHSAAEAMEDSLVAERGHLGAAAGGAIGSSGAD